MSAFERLKEWSERFAATDPIAAEVAELVDRVERLQEYEGLASSRWYEIQRLTRIRDTAAQLCQALDRARDGGEVFPLEISVAGGGLHEALEGRQ